MAHHVTYSGSVTASIARSRTAVNAAARSIDAALGWRYPAPHHAQAVYHPIEGYRPPEEACHMAADELKSRLSARIWQSIAQSHIEVSSIPPDQLEALVDAVAEGIVETLAETSAEAGVDGGTTTELPDERVLWSGRPFLSMVEQYTISTERIRVRSGLLSKANESVELVRVQDLDYRQSLGERILGIGDVSLRSSDPSHPQLTLRNVRHPERVHDTIRRAVLSARQRHRFSFQEEM
jgi:hypothetical protein